MDVKVIGTGSTGNMVLLNGCILLDCGLPYSRLQPYVKGLKLVVVTHQHTDHFKKATVHSIASARPTLRWAGGPWMVPLFLDAGVDKRNIDVLRNGLLYDYQNHGGFKLETFDLHHNVPNLGTKVYIGGEKAVYAVDTGYIDDIDAKDFDIYLIEANHKEAEIAERIRQKQASGEFAYETEAQKNHLSYEQAMNWLAKNVGPNSQYILLHGHVEKGRKDETEA